ncbi:MAG TPA: hypothetical protein DEH78_00755 [Solibacterales bacterium]|nr:hypothetical protein [Bryobacterales bacterium]
MKLRICLVFAVLLVAVLATAQIPRQRNPNEPEDVRLPSGKRQTEEILKVEHEKNLEDAAELVKLAEDLKAELEKNDRYVLSLGAIKKTDEIEKIAKRIRSRLRRF